MYVLTITHFKSLLHKSTYILNPTVVTAKQKVTGIFITICTSRNNRNESSCLHATDTYNRMQSNKVIYVPNNTVTKPTSLANWCQ